MVEQQGSYRFPNGITAARITSYINNVMIHEFGFSEDYERLDEDNKHLISARNPDIKIKLELTGSGFLRLSRLYPLMVVSKTRGLMMIATDPYDYCLHPILGRALMKWFLKDNSNPPIGKLSNIMNNEKGSIMSNENQNNKVMSASEYFAQDSNKNNSYTKQNSNMSGKG